MRQIFLGLPHETFIPSLYTMVFLSVTAGRLPR